MYLRKFIFGSTGSSCYLGFSLVAANRGYSLVAALGLRLLRSTGFSSSAVGLAVVFPGLWSTGSVVSGHEISCSAVYGIFLDQG